MDIYTVFFILSTFWVGPFWFAMLLNPQKEKTKKLLSGPLFFLGPIMIWILVMAMNPQGLVDFANSGSHPDGFFAGLAAGMSSPAAITAMWAHMVAGDICVTRWIWKEGLRQDTNKTVSRLAIFFGVMLMPLGLAIHLLFGKIKNTPK
tara:strand:- start:11 stop:454 length:444 start_codon:yes stop_codon:yes gene_type:complete